MEESKNGESILEYRMEQVEKKLDQVERKLDKVTDLLLQTAEQEQRIKTLETAINEIKDSNKKILTAGFLRLFRRLFLELLLLYS